MKKENLFLLFVLLAVIIFLPANADSIYLPKTGQATSYAGGDDGDLEAGVTWPSPRFTNPDGSTPVSGGVVLDQLTGLYWQRDGDASSLRNVTSGITYCETTQDGLGGFTDWRLSNILELESLTHAEQSSTATWLNSQGFQDIQAWYWTSNKYAAYDQYGWAFNFGPSVHIGDVYGPGDYYTYTDLEEDWTTSHYILCVRGGANGADDPAYPANVRKTGQTTVLSNYDDGWHQWGVAWPNPRYTDNGSTMTDNLTGLMWTKSGNRIYAETGGCFRNWDVCGGWDSMAKVTSWTQALAFIDDMNNGTNNSLLCGGDNVCENFTYTDWRLPNKKEIYSLTHWEQIAPAARGDESVDNLIAYGFTELCQGWCGSYWTSTTDPSQTDRVFGIGFFAGGHQMGTYPYDTSGLGWWSFPPRLLWPVRTIPAVIDLEINKSVDNSTPDVGSTVTFTVAVTNNGPSNVTGVSVEDVVPDGYSNIQNISNFGTESGGTITWSWLNIGSGGSVNLTFDVDVNASGNYTNVAQVTAAGQADSDSTPDNNILAEDDQDDETVNPVPIIDLELDKSVNDGSSTVTFTVAVTNNGPSNATGVAVEDVVPDGYRSIRNISNFGTESGGTITWSGLSINNGATVNLTFVVDVNASGNYTNVAQVTAAGQRDSDSTPNNDSGTEDDEDTAGAVSIPTITEWGMIVFMILAGLGAVYYLRARRFTCRRHAGISRRRKES